MLRQLDIRIRRILFVDMVWLVAATGLFIVTNNSEFLIYIGVILAIGTGIVSTLKYTKFTPLILWLLSVWAFMHLLGGIVYFGGIRLYSILLIPLYGEAGDGFALFRYDQAIHFFGFAIVMVAVHHVLRLYRTGPTTGFIHFIAVLAAMGIGSINEIVEFCAVLVFERTGVGDYYNTLLDLVFNALGALSATVIIGIRERSSHKVD